VEHLVRVSLTMSLTLMLWACQTLTFWNGSEKEEQVIMSHKSMIVSHLDKGNPQIALNELRPLLQHYPERADLQNLMGLTQIGLRNPDRAVIHLKKAYESSNELGYGLNLTSAYLEAGQYMKANELLAKLIRDGKDYRYRERLFHNRGLVAEAMGQVKAAEKHYNEALAENPGFYPTHLQLAKLYERNRSPQKALDSYERAFESCKRCIEPLSALIPTYVARGDRKKARELLRDFLAITDLEGQDRKKAKGMLSLVQRANKAATVP